MALSRLDNWLIDSVFQPVCDWIRGSIGWSKKVPAAIFLVASAASLVPFMLWRLKMGDSLFFIPLLLIMNAHQAARLFEEEIKGDEDTLELISPHRLRSAWLRKTEVVVLLIASILFFLLLAVEGKPFPLHIKSLVSWVATDAIALYFLACTNVRKLQRRRFVTTTSS